MVQPPQTAALALAVVQAARRVFRQAHRRFIQPDDPVFVDLVVEALGLLPDGQLSPETVERWVTKIYSQLLGAAFLSDGTEEQVRAFAAAQSHVAAALVYRLQDEMLAARLAQDVLTSVWSTLRATPMRDMRAFLGYLRMSAIRLMLREIKHARLTTTGSALPLPDGAESDSEIERVPASPGDDRPVEGQVLAVDLSSRVRAAIQHCLKDRPTLRRIIEAHMLDGKGYAELAREWGVSTLQLAQDKFQALKALRGCPQLQALR